MSFGVALACALFCVTAVGTHVAAGPAALDQTLYPLGFSESGDFAFVRFSYSDAAAHWQGVVVIQSLVTDRKKVQVDWTVGDLEGGDRAWLRWTSRHGQELESLLSRYKIDRSRPCALAAFPLSVDGNDWTAAVAKGRVIVRSSVRGRKSIGTIPRHNVPNIPETYGHRVAGYYKSPFEERIAVIVTGWAPGWEGPPDTGMLWVFGSSLDSGFR
ncbi:MAG: hypothetical protein AAFU77_05060 [Myxococcota bacterium]